MVRINTIFKRLRGKRILILGFGREGKSSLAFLKKFLPHAEIGIADKNEAAFKDLSVNPNDPTSPKFYYGENYFDAINDYDIVWKTPGISLLNCVSKDLKKVKRLLRKAKLDSQYNICDGMGWDSPIVEDYAVDMTPSLFLLDEDKVLIAKPFDIEEVEEKLTI